MPSSHTALDHGGKQAAQKRKLVSLVLPYVRCQISKLIRTVEFVEGFWFFGWQSVLMATEMLLVCGEDLNSLWAAGPVVWKTQLAFMEPGKHFEAVNRLSFLYMLFSLFSVAFFWNSFGLI